LGTSVLWESRGDFLTPLLSFASPLYDIKTFFFKTRNIRHIKIDSGVKCMDNRAFTSMFLFLLVVASSVMFSVIAYSQDKAKKDKTLTVLEVTGGTETTIIVKNIGKNVASNLSSFPPAVFEPRTIAPDEETVGTFSSPLKDFTLITVRSAEGSEVRYRYRGGLRG
jgi:hypothetical protein